ncbi:unnamed protein product [Boreogadus saida]
MRSTSSWRQDAFGVELCTLRAPSFCAASSGCLSEISRGGRDATLGTCSLKVVTQSSGVPPPPRPGGYLSPERRDPGPPPRPGGISARSAETRDPPQDPSVSDRDPQLAPTCTAQEPGEGDLLIGG